MWLSNELGPQTATSWSVDVIKAGLHYYQSFCDHSRNFALVNSEGTDSVLINTKSVSLTAYLTNPSKLRIYTYVKFLLCAETFDHSVNQP